jgi:histidyl-tRNA synthetase
MQKKKVVPGLAAGFRDYLPEEMIPRQHMTDVIRAIFERYGFLPIDTPGIERLEVLTGGDKDFKKQIFTTSKARGDDVLALRFDLTVPLARVIAQYPGIRKPFKRYHIGKSWRGEKPQTGRLREFMQCDADIVGSSSMMADAEVISLGYETLRALGVRNFTMKVNNRKILEALPKAAGFPEKKLRSVLRIIDKLDKIGSAKVKEALIKEEKLSEKQSIAIRSIIETKITPGEDIEKAFGSHAALMKEGIEELRQISTHLAALGMPNDAWIVDASVARGLGYYTGPVFETTLNDLPGIGSVCSGGRYNGLVAQFGQSAIPAVGISIGLDRLFAALTQLGLLVKTHSVANAIFLNFEKQCEEYIEESAARLRSEGIRTEIYFGNEDTIKGQLAYALHREVPIILIAGSEEKTRGTLQIKNVIARTQIEVARADAGKAIKKILGMEI